MKKIILVTRMDETGHDRLIGVFSSATVAKIHFEDYLNSLEKDAEEYLIGTKLEEEIKNINEMRNYFLNSDFDWEVGIGKGIYSHRITISGLQLIED